MSDEWPKMELELPLPADPIAKVRLPLPSGAVFEITNLPLPLAEELVKRWNREEK